MTEVHEGLEAKEFERPESIINLNVCTVSGKLPTELCKRDPRGSTIKNEIFVRGTQPTEFCDVHVEVEVDTSTNKIANEYCPEGNIEKRVFIKRNPPYNPEANNGIMPSDYQYTAPTEVCDEHTEGSWIEDWLDNWFNRPGRDNGDENEDESQDEGWPNNWNNENNGNEGSESNNNGSNNGNNNENTNGNNENNGN